jgi:hypothetical protein
MTLKKKIGLQFPGAEIEEVGNLLVVHVDKPDYAERVRRRKEAKAGGPVDDDCPICLALRKYPPNAMIYDADAVLCLGVDDKGSYATGFPRKKVDA